MSEKLDFFKKLKTRLAHVEKDSLYQKLFDAVQENALLGDLCQNLDEGVVLTDAQGVPFFINQKAEGWLGFRLRAGNKRPLGDCVQDTGLGALLSRELPGVRTRTVQDHKVLVPREVHLRVTFAPCEQEGKRAVMLILADITHRTDEEFEALMLSRMESLIRLAGGIAHEIGNPLNAITIHLELLKKQLSGLPPAKRRALEHFVTDIQDETRRLDRVVRHFLSATRKPPLRFQVVDLHGVIADAVHFLKPQLDERGVRVKFSREPKVPPFLMDRERLYAAFMNLIKNAMEAMRPGGLLKITVTRKEQCAVIAFADTGCGIEEEDLARIFDIYYTTKKEGSGLGLMMVYDAVSEHGGKVEVTSKRGKGATFKVLLPIREPQRQLPHLQPVQGG
ncbi:MAG: PAS domain-containing protein [Candidatus Omnitrophica bacterium]|nr:PAS domain-containing protein [Candidatus Omnitrophota bacterium]